MRNLDADRDSPEGKLDLLTGGMIRSGRTGIELYEELFRQGSEVLFLKAKSVLVGVGVFSGISNISIPQVNANFRRLCLDARWTNTTCASPAKSNASVFHLYHLHIYMEIIRAYMALYKSPGRGQSTISLASPLSTIHSEYFSSQDALPADSKDVELILRINSTIDDYLIKLMKIKTRSLKLLSVHQRDRLYAFLGVAPDVSDAVLKRAYRQKAMELHPDKGGSKEMFQELNEVYETIMEERGISCGPMEPEDSPSEVSPNDVGSCHTPSPPKISGKENAKAESVVKLLKAATACISGAKKATETASDFIEKPDTLKLVEFIKHVREVGYAFLDSSCVVDESLKQTVSAAGFDILNSANDISVNDDYIASTSVIETIGELTKKCVSCAQFMSRISQLFDEKTLSLREKSNEKISSRENERLVVANRQRVENAQLLKKLNDELMDQHHQLVHMVEDEELEKSHDIIEWYRLAVCDHVQDCLVELKDWLRGNPKNGDDLIDEFINRFQLFDQLSIPATAIGRACRLVYITNQDFVKKRVFDQVISGLVRLGLGTFNEDRLREKLVSALGRVEPLHLAKVQSIRSSTRSSPIIRPIELGELGPLHSSRIPPI